MIDVFARHAEGTAARDGDALMAATEEFAAIGAARYGVLDQAVDRVGDRLTRSHRGDHTCALVARCSTSAAEAGSSSCASSTPSAIGRSTARSRNAWAHPRIRDCDASSPRVCEQTRERAERDCRGAARGLHPLRIRPAALRIRKRLAGQPGLARTRLTADDNAGSAAFARGSDPLQFGLATDQ